MHPEVLESESQALEDGSIKYQRVRRCISVLFFRATIHEMKCCDSLFHRRTKSEQERTYPDVST